MHISPKKIRPIIETRYLSVENTDRYRMILKIFFQHYEKFKYHLYQEDVYNEMIEYDYFKDYTVEQCQQDLSALVEWKNLTHLQDTKNAANIEEFKNKKYRYQLSKYGVEIERLTLKLENLSSEGASLESSFLEDFNNEINKFSNIINQSDEKIYSWWNKVNDDFVKLNQNYQDFLRENNNIGIDDLLEINTFLSFKNKLVDYLRNFVKHLQMYIGSIEYSIKNISDEDIEMLIEKYINYKKNSIPILNNVYDEKEDRVKNLDRWQNIKDWFVEDEFGSSEAMKLFTQINEIIRKVTRYASRISEMVGKGANRKEEYKKISDLFYDLDDIKEAHKLSSLVFGVEEILHIKDIPDRSTDNINSGVYDEEPFVKKLSPRIRTYREKTKRTAIKYHHEDKKRIIEEELNRIKILNRKIEELEDDGKIIFRKLPIIDSDIREVLLSWISNAHESDEKEVKTENGRLFRLVTISKKDIEIQCTDGVFIMPDMEIVFK